MSAECICQELEPPTSEAPVFTKSPCNFHSRLGTAPEETDCGLEYAKKISLKFKYFVING